ncbi:MAG: hypothetical protein CSA76_04040 [Spirochaetales bacterium]|nr:MAG: hypothetical protein CSA76_04040 [Spirochaetales bacterium]
MFAAALTTVAGGFVFGFIISKLWVPLVENVGILGGFVAAGFIVGGMWTVNHGAGFVVQGVEAPWVDQAWSAFWGLFVSSLYLGGKFKKAVPSLIYSIIGGTLGGFILANVGLGTW